jgi:hypothetical protein
VAIGPFYFLYMPENDIVNSSGVCHLKVASPTGRDKSENNFLLAHLFGPIHHGLPVVVFDGKISSRLDQVMEGRDVAKRGSVMSARTQFYQDDHQVGVSTQHEFVCCGRQL